jgi:hypothetical protein
VLQELFFRSLLCGVFLQNDEKTDKLSAENERHFAAKLKYFSLMKEKRALFA